ncbi:hypothetical protein PIB30_074686, partial [Stylosanthes scabra]|nr:hypothetical protein [Stylosanthes scabra]
LLLDSLILVGSILHLIVVYYLIRFGILAEIVGLLKIRITFHHVWVTFWLGRNVTQTWPCVVSHGESWMGHVWTTFGTWFKRDFGSLVTWS